MHSVSLALCRLVGLYQHPCRSIQISRVRDIFTWLHAAGTHPGGISPPSHKMVDSLLPSWLGQASRLPQRRWFRG